jgi:methionine biosynthesis protein MetW
MGLINNQQRNAYTGLRSDVIELIKGNPIKVLDVGCSNGVLLGYLKSKLGASYTVGIECDPGFAEEAAKNADRIIVADLDTFDVATLDESKFDLIVLADVLEHTKNPASVLREILKSAEPNAQVVLALPNIQHWTAIKNLFIGEWPQLERGLFDKTHLRFFTFRSIKDLADISGLEIEEVSCNFRFVDAPRSRINRFAKIFAFRPLKPFFAYQYVLRLRYAKCRRMA